MTVWIVLREDPIAVMAVHADAAAAGADMLQRNQSAGGIRYRVEEWAVQQR